MEGYIKVDGQSLGEDEDDGKTLAAKRRTDPHCLPALAAAEWTPQK